MNAERIALDETIKHWESIAQTKDWNELQKFLYTKCPLCIRHEFDCPSCILGKSKICAYINDWLESHARNHKSYVVLAKTVLKELRSI